MRWLDGITSAMDMKVKVSQSCLTLCDPMDYTVNGILQARILEWVAVPFSRRSSQLRDRPRSPALQAETWVPSLDQEDLLMGGYGNPLQ